MRIAEPPSLDSPRRGPSCDDLDGLLRSFFRAEMPEPWPALELPAEETILPLPARPRPHRWKTFRARFALAASVAFLLACAWLIGNSLGAGSRAGSASNPSDSASVPTDMRHGAHGHSDPQIRKEFMEPDRLKLEFDNDGVLPQ